jgi:hypothetical protein
MDYLIRRINGQLETLKICKCFIPSIVDQAIVARPDRPTMEEMYNEFQRNLLNLLRANRGMTKFTYEQNGYQMFFFQELAAEENNGLLQVPDLKIVLAPTEPVFGYVPFIQYMAQPHPEVRKLHFQVMGFIASATFDQAIESFKPTLEEFTFQFAGNNLGVNPLDVSDVRGFTRLKKLVFRDTKVD